jgi:DNA-binding winged helix-turn-helix (wHTH) protein
VIVTFEELELDLSQVERRRSGARVRVEPQVFEVLAYLVNHRDRVVPKEELMDSVWGGQFVSETAVTSRIKQARQAIGDNGQAQRLIRTVHGRGYQLVGRAREAGPVSGARREPVRYAVSDGLQIAYQVTGVAAVTSCWWLGLFLTWSSTGPTRDMRPFSTGSAHLAVWSASTSAALVCRTARMTCRIWRPGCMTC